MPYYLEFDLKSKRCIAVHNVVSENELEKVKLSSDNIIMPVDEETGEELMNNLTFPDYVLSSEGMVFSPIEPGDEYAQS